MGVQLSSLKCKEMPSSKKDKNGNEISQETEEEKQNRINRNMAKFLSMEKQQQQLVLCLRQQQMPKNLLQMGALRKTTVAYGHESYLDHAEDMLEPDLRPVRPQPNSPESMQIYADHRLMAAEFLELHKEIESVKNYKLDLEEQLRQSELQMDEVAAKSDSEEAKKFVQLQKEKDQLVQFKEKLSTQLQLIKKAQTEQNKGDSNTEKTPPTTNLEEDWVLVHESTSAAPNKVDKS